MRRLIVLLVVVLGLAPGTWLRSPRPPADSRDLLSYRALPLPKANLGPLELLGAWQLRSPNSDFGSYSALVVVGNGTLLAASDRGGFLRFAAPGADRPRVKFGSLSKLGRPERHGRDVEALTRDPASGRIWAAFERTHSIERYDASLGSLGGVQPEAMRDWWGNLGAEAMARLADGRFVVLAEGATGWFEAAMPALLFPRDPLTGAEPLRFRFIPPEGFRPVDIAQLPDGRVVILLRDVELGVPPRFHGKLMLADPAAIRAGRPWPATLLADLGAPLPSDNYEGLAVEPDGRGGAVLWLISDDNGMPYQRTLLLALGWPAREKAPGLPRAPR